VVTAGPKAIKYFETSMDHVLAELELMALKLDSRARSIRQSGGTEDTDKFKGLYISDREIDQFLERKGNGLIKDNPKKKTYPANSEEKFLKELEKEIARKKSEALNRGLKLRLDILQNLFGLSRIELETILICLLGEIDPRYQKLYAYLQDDITKKAPTINLILSFLCDSAEDTFRTREYFYQEAPLIKKRIVSLQDDRVAGSTLFMAKSIRLDERITGYLSGRDSLDSRLTTLANMVVPSKKWADVVGSGDLKKRLIALISKNKNISLICCLSGAHGSNSPDIAESICSELGMPMLIVSIRALLAANTQVDSLVPLVFREGALQNAVIYLDGFSLLTGENKDTLSVYDDFILELRSYPYWIIPGLEKEWHPEDGLIEKPCINVILSSSSYAERIQIWEKLVKSDRSFGPDLNIADLAGKFKLNSGQIIQAANTARNLARWRDPETGQVTIEDLNAACRKQSGENLSALARKIQPLYKWEDIILPKDQMEQLREICTYVEHYHTVYDAWGFGRKISLGKGLKVLFAGPSGTGKTMAAEVIGNELNLDIYKIDLSTIVSKYIGETEKNLDKIFREGQTSNAILFFDEADALFGKRSEVKDAHDRYANIETSYLLQKMDEYEGIAILATNLRKNMDEAFARRMHYTLEFPIPEEPDRYRIWQQVFPKELPQGKDIDFKFLAKQFKISGGNIKNIALNAAFLAAANGGLVNMENLIKATKREYQKIGKLCTEGDFGEYFELVKN
jgi:AAA+ superfamily predicted ATPase